MIYFLFPLYVMITFITCNNDKKQNLNTASLTTEHHQINDVENNISRFLSLINSTRRLIKY